MEQKANRSSRSLCPLHGGLRVSVGKRRGDVDQNRVSYDLGAWLRAVKM